MAIRRKTYGTMAAGTTALVGLAILAGCAGRPAQVAVAPPPAQLALRPMPPLGATPSMTVPAIGADGRRITPNRNLTPAEAIWHMRMALNVAALSCRDAADAPRLQYNHFLARHKMALAQANATVDAHFRSRFGNRAIDVRDSRNTMIYNFFALPPVQPGFCKAAIEVGAAANMVPSAQLSGFAINAIDLLDRPFVAFYDAYATYQVQLANWQSTSRAQQVASMQPVIRPQSAIAVAVAASGPKQFGQAKLMLDLSDGLLVSDETVTTRRGRGASRLYAAR